MPKLKPYIAHNCDGTNRAMVAACNLKEAAKKMVTTPFQLRQYGWHIGDDDDASSALATPDTILYQPIDNDRYPWSPHRWQRDYDGVATFKPIIPRARQEKQAASG